MEKLKLAELLTFKFFQQFELEFLRFHSINCVDNYGFFKKDISIYR